MTILLLSLLAIIIIASWLRVFRPAGLSVQGDVFLVNRMPLLARLRMHALFGLLATATASAIVIFHEAPVWLVSIPIASYISIVAIPVKYILTTRGIRVGLTSFRRWTEFAGVSRARGGATLQGVHGSRNLRIWLSGSRGDDEFIHLLRQSVRNGYKGESMTEIVNFSEAPADHVTIVAV